MNPYTTGFYGGLHLRILLHKFCLLTYDPFGRRIEKAVNGITTKYLYDGANILYEYDNANSITARYTHNLAIDEPLGIEKGDKLYAYHKDTLGSIRTITDSSQATINTYSYDSFGNTKQTGTLSQPYAYTSREWDKETGLYYYRARYYDPMVGRFISRDPISFKGGDVNLYAYVGNNPLNWIDPAGLTKGGKQKITGNDPLTDGISKSSSKAEIDAAIRAIEKALTDECMSQARRNFLKAFLKVAKRGFTLGVGAALTALDDFIYPNEANAFDDMDAIKNYGQ